MSDDRFSPNLEDNLRELHAMGDADIDLSDMPEVTEWKEAERGRWHRLALTEQAVALEPDLLDWFRNHSDEREDWRARVNRALREYVAQAKREAA